jgi:hypothetical protein
MNLNVFAYAELSIWRFTDSINFHFLSKTIFDENETSQKGNSKEGLSINQSSSISLWPRAQWKITLLATIGSKGNPADSEKRNPSAHT